MFFIRYSTIRLKIVLHKSFLSDSKTVHKTCTDTVPCSRSRHQHHHSTMATAKQTPTNNSVAASSKTAAQSTQVNHQRFPSSIVSTSTSSSSQMLPSLSLQCPHDGGKECSPLATAHQLLAHLRRKHNTTVTQHYCNLGDRIDVQLPNANTAGGTMASLAILKNGKTEVFLVLRRNDSCWVWYVGDAETASGFRVRIECDEVCAAAGREQWSVRRRSTKWRGAARSLDIGGRPDEENVCWSEREGCARIASGVTNVVVEIL